MNRLPSWVEVDLDAFAWNIGRVRELVPHGVRILLVVKADAYGHGAVRIARQAAECGVDMLGVATLDEGKELREAGIELPVLILSPVLREELDEVLRCRLAVSVSTFDFAADASRAALRAGVSCPVHVEVDTGMGRTGLPLEGAAEQVVRIAALEGISLEGIFTHFPASDLDDDFTADQIRAFGAVVDELSQRGVSPRYVHSANSAAIVNFPASCFNMVRPGLLAYGHSPSIALQGRVDVAPVMSFKSRLVLVRRLPAGAGISYGRTFITPAPMTVGVIAAGYGHGISHRLSNRGRVLFRGRSVPILGRVTMDMTMIELSGFDDPAAGEQVVIFGAQDEARISVDEVAAWDGSLNYEILCRISKRVVRVYMKRGRVESRKSLLGVQEES